MCYASKYSKELEMLILNIKGSYEKMKERYAELNEQFNQKYHELETRSSFNAAEGFYIAKDMQDILQKRRLAKHEMQRLELLMARVQPNALLKSVTQAGLKINKTKKLNEEYTANFKEEAFEILQ
jgi:hypothetical protein